MCEKLDHPTNPGRCDGYKFALNLLSTDVATMERESAIITKDPEALGVAEATLASLAAERETLDAGKTKGFFQKQVISLSNETDGDMVTFDFPEWKRSISPSRRVSLTAKTDELNTACDEIIKATTDDLSFLRAAKDETLRKLEINAKALAKIMRDNEDAVEAHPDLRPVDPAIWDKWTDEERAADKAWKKNRKAELTATERAMTPKQKEWYVARVRFMQLLEKLILKITQIRQEQRIGIMVHKAKTLVDA